MSSLQIFVCETLPVSNFVEETPYIIPFTISPLDSCRGGRRRKSERKSPIRASIVQREISNKLGDKLGDKLSDKLKQSLQLEA